MVLQPVYRLRLFYQKTGISAAISQLNFARIFERTLRRLDFPFKFTEGFHPRPRISFGPSLPVNISGLNEAVDVYAVKLIEENKVLTEANRLLPEGTHIHRAYWIPLHLPSLHQSASSATYIFTGDVSNWKEKILRLGTPVSCSTNRLELTVHLAEFSHKSLREILPVCHVERYIHWNGYEKE